MSFRYPGFALIGLLVCFGLSAFFTSHVLLPPHGRLLSFMSIVYKYTLYYTLCSPHSWSTYNYMYLSTAYKGGSKEA
ncbi:hypothetical protein M434DRAFT_245745 [Hypoxylon sp. CO27-5]|nr:hypothetical protein M434DRAFT_245745 [Hypoxylon sp. CO27-5]